MSPLDRRATDLQDLVQAILERFHHLNAAAANGPHVELNMQELRAIEFLGNEGPRMMRQLAEHLTVAVNSMTSIADSLEHKRLVQRQRSEEDRRIVHVELTDAGREIYQSLRKVHLQLFRTMLGELTEDEQEIFLVLFRKIARADLDQMQQVHGMLTGRR